MDTIDYETMNEEMRVIRMHLRNEARVLNNLYNKYRDEQIDELLSELGFIDDMTAYHDFTLEEME